MKILIGADLVPTQSNIDFFSNGNMEKFLDKELMNVLSKADFRVFNLEVPLTDNSMPIKKCGPNLIAPTSCINGMKKLGVDLFTLANNHIMDQDVQGLESTKKVLTENNIDYVGVGNTILEARQPYIIEKNGTKIGIYACAEHEFSIAEVDKPGANPFDPLESPDHIAELKQQCDFMIVLYHGGKEHYRYPSPNLQKICRKMCEKGVDLIICQHTHCIGCEEKYNNSTIVYGQGNFLFDASDSEFWQTSLLVSVDTEAKRIEYIPLEKRGNGVAFSEETQILKDFYKRSDEIKAKGFIEEKYQQFALKMVDGYINAFCGKNIFFKVINKLCGHKLHRKLSKKRKLAIRNYTECEAHRELFLKGISITR